MPSFILKNDYENLRPKVEELKLRFAERCSQLNLDQTKILNEFFKEILIRAVHESNWQEGIELDAGRTQELANAAFDEMEEIEGPHLDMNKILRFHRDQVLRLKRENATLEEVATFNLAAAHHVIPWVSLDLSRRETSALAHAVSQIEKEYKKSPDKLKDDQRQKIERGFEVVQHLKSAIEPTPFPLTPFQANEGNLFETLLKLDYQSLLHPMKVSYLHFFHKLVLMGINPLKNCGAFRTQSVHVGNPDVYFPVPSAVPNLIKEFCHDFPWMMRSKENDDPILIAAKVSHKFVAIHPYIDGNGRVSRLLMNLVLWGSHPPVYLKADKKGRHRYGQAIRRADRGNIKPLASLIALSLIEVYEKLLQALGAERSA